jgi:hypothetical protein
VEEDTMKRRVPFLTALAAVLLLAQTGCGISTTAAGHSPAVVLADAHGICPSHYIYGKTPPPSCLTARDWNGMSGVFKTPHRQWGVTYAFNCGSHAGNFTVDTRMPGMDHMGIPGPERHARKGSGYIMYSKKQMTDLIDAVPPEFAMDGRQMALMIASTCTWHVKAILGSKAEVAAAVPPIPAVQSPWWK